MSGPRRLIRLQNDYHQMNTMHQRNGMIQIISTNGLNPPEEYVVGFRCRGVTAIQGNEPIIGENHKVRLVLTSEYPRIRPLMRWLTPLFHPNFNDDGAICIKAWYPQQTLVELCEVLCEMVQYKNYNTTSPLNWDAAQWAMRNRAALPIDNRNLYTRTTDHAAIEPTRTVYDAKSVVIGTIPIWTPVQLQTPEQPVPIVELPALDSTMPDTDEFCQNCGFAFHRLRPRNCPQCNTKRE